MTITSPPHDNPRLRKFNLGLLIALPLVAVPVYALLGLVLAFCDAPGAWCANPTNLRLIGLFGWWLPLAIWLALLYGVVAKRPWRPAIYAGAVLLAIMLGGLVWIGVLFASS